MCAYWGHMFKKVALSLVKVCLRTHANSPIWQKSNFDVILCTVSIRLTFIQECPSIPLDQILKGIAAHSYFNRAERKPLVPSSPRLCPASFA